MKALWVDAGNDPDYAKVTKHGMTHLFFALNDPRVTSFYLNKVVVKDFGVGVYAVPNWPGLEGNGKQFADKVSSLVRPLISGPTLPRVQLDMEMHDPVFILTALSRFRALHPYQALSWTMESFQGGWMTPEFVKAVLALKVRVVPQFYIGDMEAVAQDMALRDLLRSGFPESSVTGFYDAAALPRNWDGFAFTQGRLP